MEKEVKVSGKDFEAHCQKCPSMQAFNRQIIGKNDTVLVTCASIIPDCALTKEVKKRGD